MAKKASGPTADELVTKALLTAATADGPVRLSGKGDYPALFTSKTGANKDAIEQCLSPERPLLAVAGRAKTEAVRLTPAGFQRVLAQIPEEKVGPAAKAVAAELPAGERAAFLNEIVSRTPAAAAELLPLYEEALAAEQAENEARVVAAAKRREQAEAVRQAMTRWLELEERGRKQRIEALERELITEGGKPPKIESQPQPQDVTPMPRLKPDSREDITFRRDVASRLVATWLESFRLNKPEGRLFLETAMGNMGGLRQVGEEGERVPFDGKYHESDVGVTTGAPVRVVRPGWVLEEEHGEHRLVAAKVSP